MKDIERTWWRLFENCVVRTKCDLYVFITFIFNSYLLYL